MVTCYYFPSLLWQIPMDGRGAYYSVQKCRNVDQLSLRRDVRSFLLWSNMHMNTTAGQTSCQDKPSLVTPTLPPSPQMFPICPQISFHHFSLPCQNTCSYVWLHNTFGNKQYTDIFNILPSQNLTPLESTNALPLLLPHFHRNNTYLYMWLHTQNIIHSYMCTFTIQPYKTITKRPLVLPHSPSHHYHTRISFSSPFINKSPVRCHKCTSHSIVVARVTGL